MKYTFTFLFFFFVGNTIIGSNYYISPNGNDANDGLSPATAFQTLQHVNTINFLPGDVIQLEGGQTHAGKLKFTESGTFANPITITSYNGIARVQTLNHGLSILIEDASHFIIKNLIVEGDYISSTDNTPNDTNSNAGISVIAKTSSIDHVIIDNVEVLKFEYHGIKIRADLAALTITNIQILNSFVHDCGYAGIFTKGIVNMPIYNIQNLRIENCVLSYNRGWSTSAAGNGILLANTLQSVVRYCEAHHNGGNNGSADWDNDGIIDQGLTGFGGGGGIWAVNSKDILFEYNESHHNETDYTDGNGFDMDGGVINGIMQYNYSHDNEGAGFVVFQYDPVHTSNITIRYNISENDGQNDEQIRQGVFHIHRDTTVNTFADIFIYNNTVYNDNPNVYLIKTRNGGESIDNLVFANNIFIHPNGGNQYDHNGNHILMHPNPLTHFGEVDHYYNNFMDTEDGNSLLNAPGTGGTVHLNFGNLTGYIPGSNAPVIDAGIDVTTLGIGFPLPNPTQDFLGNPTPLDLNYDIGAIEVNACALTNDIVGGGFDGPTGPIPNWTFQNQNNSLASAFLDGTGVAIIDIGNGGMNDFDIQLRQDNISLSAGNLYVLKIKVFALQERMIGVKLRNRMDGSIKYIDKQISIGPQPEEFAFVIQPNGTDTDVRLVLLFGSDTNTVFLDDVSIKKHCTNVNTSEIDCVDHLQLLDMNVTDNLYKAMQTISSNATIDTNQNVIFQGNEFIHLEGGFNTKLNVQFEALINSCN